MMHHGEQVPPHLLIKIEQRDDPVSAISEDDALRIHWLNLPPAATGHHAFGHSSARGLAAGTVAASIRRATSSSYGTPRWEGTEAGMGYAGRAGHCCILGSCVGSAYMRGQPRLVASGRSS
jgi:hypothetical protein